ncbi:tail fiber protein [Yersinia phage PYPS2T]|uniref:Long tail fiber protein Gp37 n=1 Tax=Yersinia phage PYPS2T TaxID=2321390 RepID=A0A3B8DYL2_9CAUD|nr:long tail fiber protein distal subunit [Yersinia phage PYPS2T]AYJ74494.1 large tail fiber subunit [Yersinia phage PYPS2T]QNJ49544.1 tail fiber protein [Yersinia phage PYps11T]QOI70219.1 tail fiber protein [Yersinia phage PYPS2T]QOI70755.1 tail fiber protein [Yersinia phage PYps10T]
MATLKQIQFKRSKTAGQRPAASVLAEGELAINLKDKTIFTKDDSGSVIELGLKYGGTINGSLEVTENITGTLIGNSSTATKLQTPRKINGISFDGSKDITLTPSDINVNSTTFIKNNGELPTDANLDTYGPIEEYLGVWSKSTSTNAQPANKFPEENAVGVLEVFVAGQFAGTQRYTVRSGNVYIRSLSAKWNGVDGPWGVWRNVQASTRPLSQTIDLDSLGELEHCGLWRNSSSAIASFDRHYPEEGSAAQGFLEIFEGGLYTRTQRYTTRMGMVYTRCLAAAWDASAPKWEEWKQVGHGTPATFYDGDLNDFKTPGLYNILGTDAVINCPTGEGLPAVIVGLLEVKQRASGGAIFQKFTTAGTGATTRDRIFERAYTGGAWGAWNEVYTSYSLPITLGMGGIKAQLAELDWQTFDFVPGSMFSVPLNKIKNMPANMDWGTIDGNLVMFSVGPSEHTSTGRTVQVWRGTVSQTNYRYFVVRVFGNSGNRTCTVRRVVLEDGRHTWTAQQDFNGAVNFGAPTNFNSTVNLNNTTTFKTEVKFRSSNAFRMYGGKFGTIFRNDGESLYILSTDENDQDGNFNTNRPFRYELRTGDVTLGGTSGANVLKLKRDSLTAFFGGDINIKGLMTFDAGRLGSRDYFKFNHWGDSNNARDNIIQLEDSKGVHFSTERTLATGAIKTKFFGEVESEGRLIIKRPGDSIVLLTTAGNALHIRGDVDGSGNWYIGKGGSDNSLAFYSYATQAAVHITNNGEISLNPQNIAMVNVNRDRVHINGSGWIARQPGDWGNQWRVEAPLFVDHGYVSQDCYYPIIKGKSVITNQGFVTAVDLGIRRVPNNWGQAIIRVGSAEASPATGHPNAVFEFHYDGTFYSPGNGNFNDVYIRSDGRLKINKKELENGALEKVCRLKVYIYDKVKSIKDRSVIKREVGIIAQDLEKELPEAVSKVEVDGSDVLTISNSAVNALLIKAIQEMSEEIKELKTPFFTKIARKISNYFKF